MSDHITNVFIQLVAIIITSIHHEHLIKMFKGVFNHDVTCLPDCACTRLGCLTSTGWYS